MNKHKIIFIRLHISNLHFALLAWYAAREERSIDLLLQLLVGVEHLLKVVLVNSTVVLLIIGQSSV